MFGAVRLGWLPERRRHALACLMSPPPEMATGETHSRAKEPMNRAKILYEEEPHPFLIAGGSAGAIAVFQAYLDFDKKSRDAIIEARKAEANAKIVEAQAKTAQHQAETARLQAQNTLPQ